MTKTGIKLLKTTIALGVFAGLTACQGSNGQQAGEVSTAKDSTPLVSEDNSATMESMTLDQQLAFSRSDLVDRLNIAQESITIKGVRNVTWSSGALGCPKPGMSYIQVLVPGVLILLDAEGKTYGYHAAKNEKPFHCPPRQAVIPGSIQKEDLA